MGGEAKKQIAIIGSGPAGLMAATVAARAGLKVVIFEKRNAPAHKLILAGKSGLNVTHDCPLETFHTHYRGDQQFIKKCLAQFSPKDWLKFLSDLSIKTFLGTSRRFFVEGLHSDQLLGAWIKRLKGMGVEFVYGHEVTDFSIEANKRIKLEFAGKGITEFAAVCFCLGGASYSGGEAISYPKLFLNKGIGFEPFRASNVGYEIDWSPAFLKEAEGKPLKNIALTTGRGTERGELMVTRYGLEGTPIYMLGEAGPAFLDLKPDLSKEDILKKLSSLKKKMSPIRCVQHALNLCPAAFALLYHGTNTDQKKSLEKMTGLIKKFPLTFKNPRPLDEAISSAGGLKLDELDKNLMLKKIPGVFVAGEMLDWDAPTGGFLIQACVSQGFVAGRGMVNSIQSRVTAVTDIL